MRDTLKGRDIKRILRAGIKISGQIGSAIILKNRDGDGRLSTVVPNKICNAVKRNRIRRIFQEAFRDIKKNPKINLDIVVLPGHRAIKSNFWDAKLFLEQILNRYK